eukprot:TRINITY_DN11970_c0_g1_i1.p1 TRINITY_DN11970_c0_g1~~TRINITY_DN11970_c0_g1_i1.p1  ORF type:complete len:986 (-),score=271.05 TRINITY_DN11970_c0_g1_i1:8-2743(-)
MNEKEVYGKKGDLFSFVPPLVTDAPLEFMVNFWKDKEGCRYETMDLGATLDVFVGCEDLEVYVLMGEGGYGKSLACYHYGSVMMKQWWKHLNDPTVARPPYFPLFLRSLVDNWSVEALKDSFKRIQNKLNLPDIPFLLIIDGFHELGYSESVDIVSHLGIPKNTKLKVLVTCRLNVIDRKDYQKVFGPNNKMNVYRLVPFSNGQIFNYLQNELHWSDKRKSNYQKLITSSENLLSFFRNPFILYLMKESWEQLQFGNLNRIKIYNAYITHIIQSKSTLLSSSIKEKLIGNFSSLAESYQNFLNQISWLCCQNSTFSLSDKQVEPLKAKNPWLNVLEFTLEDAKNEFLERTKKSLENKRRMVLTEDDYVNLIQKRTEQFLSFLPLKLIKNEYQFIHKSICEYSIAKFFFSVKNAKWAIEPEILRVLQQNDPVVYDFLSELWPSVSKQEIVGSTPNTFRFLKYLADRMYDTSEFKRSLYYQKKILLITKHHRMFIDFINTYTEISTLHNTLGFYDKSLKYLKKAYRRVKNTPNKSLLSDIYQKLGVTYRNKEETQKAMYYLKYSLAINTQEVGEDDTSLSSLYFSLGSCCNDMGQFDRAIIYFKKCLAMEIEDLVDDEEIAHTYSSIGLSYQFKGDYDKALQIYSDCLQAAKNDLLKASTLVNIASVLEFKGEYDKAIENCEKALEIQKKIFGDKHQDIADTYNMLGVLYGRKGQIQKSIQYFELCEGIQTYFKDIKGLKITYHNVGKIYIITGDYEKALQYFTKSLDEKAKKDLSTAKLFQSLGIVHGHLGKYVEGLDYLNQSLQIQSKFLGPTHPELSITYCGLGSLYNHLKEPTKALEYIQKSLEIQEKTFGSEHLIIATTFIVFGEYYKDQGILEQSSHYFNLAWNIYLKVYGEDNPSLSIFKHKLLSQ